jgi:hypothetical protein
LTFVFCLLDRTWTNMHLLFECHKKCNLTSKISWFTQSNILDKSQKIPPNMPFLVKRLKCTVCQLVRSIFSRYSFPETKLSWGQYITNMCWLNLSCITLSRMNNNSRAQLVYLKPQLPTLNFHVSHHKAVQ